MDTSVEEIIDDTYNSNKAISMASALSFAYC